MNQHPLFRALRWPLAFLAVLAIVSMACAIGGPYHEEFNSIGTWPEQDTFEAAGTVTDGAYVFTVKQPEQYFWATGGEDFGDGTYEVEATAVSGSENNGFGMLFFVDNDTDSFISFEVSSDGYVAIARWGNAGEEVTPLVQDGWFESAAVSQGLNQTNVLRVEVSAGTMNFFVNGQNVGSATDTTFTSGDIAVVVETFEEGGVTVNFDNFKFTPPADE